MQTAQSAPDVSGKIVCSASIAKLRIDLVSFSSRTPSVLKLFINYSRRSFPIAIRKIAESDAAAATQHADDDPSPTPMGMSESIVISSPSADG